MKILLLAPWAYDEGLEKFFLKALRKLGHEVELATEDGDTFDLFISMKAPVLPTPRARVNADITALYFPDYTKRFPEQFAECRPETYDFVFLPHKEDIVDNKRIFHLPVGYDPQTHFPVESDKEILLLFVGTWREERDWIKKLPEVRIYGNGWGPFIQPVYGAKKREIYGRSSLALNHHYQGETQNMRLYEALAMRSCLLTDLPGEFEDGEHLIVYQDTFHLSKWVRRLLDKPEERMEIAMAGYKAVKPYTYEYRMKQMLEMIQ